MTDQKRCDTSAGPRCCPRCYACVCGGLASFFALVAGLWLFNSVGWFSTAKDDALSMALGFYFLAKAFFLGPMLAITAKHLPCHCKPACAPKSEGCCNKDGGCCDKPKAE